MSRVPLKNSPRLKSKVTDMQNLDVIAHGEQNQDSFLLRGQMTKHVASPVFSPGEALKLLVLVADTVSEATRPRGIHRGLVGRYSRALA
jgi:hypothetical protein